MEERIVEVKLEKTEWIKLNFIFGYSNKWIIYITLVGLGMLYTVIDYLIWNSYNTIEFPLFQLLFAIFILIVLPISTYLNATKIIKSSPWVSEKVRYDIDLNKFSAKGESYEWINIKSIKELKKWFVILTETKQGFFIPKRIFESMDDLANFRNVLKSVPVREIKLK